MEQIANSCGLNSQEIVCVFLCCYGLCKYIVEVFLATARSLHISLDNLDVHDEINFGVRQVREIVSHGGQFSRFCCAQCVLCRVCVRSKFFFIYFQSPQLVWKCDQSVNS